MRKNVLFSYLNEPSFLNLSLFYFIKACQRYIDLLHYNWQCSYPFSLSFFRWSAIAAMLPGRTDNEIKNYWHTNLKKRFRNNWSTSSTTVSLKVQNWDVEANQNDSSGINLLHCVAASKVSNLDGSHPMSPQLSTADLSSSSTDPAAEIDRNQTIEENVCSSETFGELQSFWEQPFSLEDLCMVETDPEEFTAQTTKTCFPEPIYPFISYEDVHHDLWFNLPNHEKMHGM